MKQRTKQNLVDYIAKKCGLTKAQATDTINAFTNFTADALVKGDQLRLKGFGTFKTLKRAQRNGRNPKTGEALVIKPHKVIRFVPADNLMQKAR